MTRTFSSLTAYVVGAYAVYDGRAGLPARKQRGQCRGWHGKTIDAEVNKLARYFEAS